MEQNSGQFQRMLAVARQRLAQHRPEEIAQRTGAALNDGELTVTTLGRQVRVRFSDYAVTPPLSKWHTLTLLHYLDLADGAPLTGQQITFAQHPDGLVRGGGFDRDAENLIRDQLGKLEPEELLRRCAILGGVQEPSNADLCVRFAFLPRYPVWLKLWFADEEFPASGRLLLEKAAPHYLTIEDAVAVGSLVLDGLTGAGFWEN